MTTETLHIEDSPADELDQDLMDLMRDVDSLPPSYSHAPNGAAVETEVKQPESDAQILDKLAAVAAMEQNPGISGAAAALGLPENEVRDQFSQKGGWIGFQSEVRTTVEKARAEKAEKDQVIMEQEKDRVGNEAYAAGMQGVDGLIAPVVEAQMAKSRLAEGSAARAMMEQNLRQQEAARHEAEVMARAQAVAVEREAYINEHGGVDNLAKLREAEIAAAAQAQAAAEAVKAAEEAAHDAAWEDAVKANEDFDRAEKGAAYRDKVKSVGFKGEDFSKNLQPAQERPTQTGKIDLRSPLERRIAAEKAAKEAAERKALDEQMAADLKALVQKRTAEEEATPPIGSDDDETNPIISTATAGAPGAPDGGDPNDPPKGPEAMTGIKEANSYTSEKFGYKFHTATLEGDELSSSYHTVTEDRLLFSDTQCFYGAIDGMGGLTAGRAAADGIEAAVNNYLENGGVPADRASALEQMRGAMRAARESVNNAGDGRGAVATFIRTFEDNGQLSVVVGHAGDTRFLIQRADNTIEDIVPEQVDEFSRNIVLNSIHEQEDGAAEFFTVVAIHDGDRLILASDGIFGDTDAQRLTDAELREALDAATPSEAARLLVEKSKKDDDKSVLVIDIEEGSMQPGEAERQTGIRNSREWALRHQKAIIGRLPAARQTLAGLREAPAANAQEHGRRFPRARSVGARVLQGVASVGSSSATLAELARVPGETPAPAPTAEAGAPRFRASERLGRLAARGRALASRNRAERDRVIELDLDDEK